VLGAFAGIQTCQAVHVVDQGSCEIWCGGPAAKQKTFIWDGVSCNCQGCGEGMGQHNCYRNRMDDQASGIFCTYSSSGRFTDSLSACLTLPVVRGSAGAVLGFTVCRGRFAGAVVERLFSTSILHEQPSSRAPPTRLDTPVPTTPYSPAGGATAQH
jgi:hypothetical protein